MLAVGSRGDVQPYIALGRALEGAGHTAIVAALDPMEDLVTRHGLTFRSLGPLPGRFGGSKAKASARFDGFGGRLAFWAVYPHLLNGRLDAFRAAVHDADLVISSRLALPAPHVAEAAGVPHVVAWPVPHTPTAAWPNPVLTPQGTAGPLRTRASWAMEFQLGHQLAHRVVNGFRTELGLEPLPRQGLRAALAARTAATLYAVSPTVVPAPDDWPPDVELTGFWHVPDVAFEPSDALATALEKRPVAVGFGSMVPREPADLLAAAREAARRHDRHVLFLAGASGLGPDDGDDRVTVTQEAPHGWLLPQVAALVHHGGIGTAAAAMRAGCPQVIVPFAYDQWFWAHRLAELGVTGRAIPEARLTADALTASLQVALAPATRERASEVADQLRQEDGLGRAVTRLEAVAGVARAA